MEPIQFSCFGCLATLRVRGELAGKVVACGKCQQRVTVPAAYVPAPPPPPEPTPAPKSRTVLRAEVDDEPIDFACMKCKEQISAPTSKCGQTIDCPECGQRTLVPDAEEVGSYGLEGKPKRGARAKPVPIAQWWPDGSKLSVHASWAADLARAKKCAELREWKQALGLLHKLRERGRLNSMAEAHVVNRPLAYCLSRWAEDELERVAGEELSKPLRKVLKKAGEQQKWGSGFNAETCALCSNRLPSIIGTVQIRTTAGSAYVCCGGPTTGDDALIRRVTRIAQKLSLATAIAPETPEVGEVMDQLPDWYRALDLSASWWVRVVTEGDDGGGGGSLLGNVLGNAVGEALGELLG
jgi:hypothetical protein